MAEWAQLVNVGGDSQDLVAPTFALTSDVHHWGRNHKNKAGKAQYTIPLAFVSGQHFSILRNGGQQHLQVHGANGIEVGGKLYKKDQQCTLEDKTEIVIKFKGEVKVRFNFVLESEEDEGDEEAEEDEEANKPSAVDEDVMEQVFRESQASAEKEKCSKLHTSTVEKGGGGEEEGGEEQDVREMSAADEDVMEEVFRESQQSAEKQKAKAQSQSQAKEGVMGMTPPPASDATQTSSKKSSQKSPLRSVVKSPPRAASPPRVDSSAIKSDAGSSSAISPGPGTAVLAAQIARLKRLNQNLEDDLATEAQRHSEASSKQRKEIHSLRTAVNEYEVRVKKLESEIEALENFKGDNSQTVPQMQVSMNALQDELEEKDETIQSLQKDLARRKKQNEEDNAAMEEFESVVTAEHQAREELERKLAAAADKIDMLENANEVTQDLLVKQELAVARGKAMYKKHIDAAKAALELIAGDEYGVYPKAGEAQLSEIDDGHHDTDDGIDVQIDSVKIGKKGGNLDKARSILMSSGGQSKYSKRVSMSQDTGMDNLSTDDDDGVRHTTASQPASDGTGRKKGRGFRQSLAGNAGGMTPSDVGQVLKRPRTAEKA